MPKAKAVKYTLIPREQEQPHKILRHLLIHHHTHLDECRIALLWRRDLKPDKDGKLVLGKAAKVSDSDKELSEYDAKIILNEEAWQEFDTLQRTALIDHELSHLQVARDRDGEIKHDERGRVVYRLRKHDIEEFSAVVSRHGMYKHDLEAFARVCASKLTAPLFPEAMPAPLPTPTSTPEAPATPQEANGAPKAPELPPEPSAAARKPSRASSASTGHPRRKAGA